MSKKKAEMAVLRLTTQDMAGGLEHLTRKASVHPYIENHYPERPFANLEGA